MRPMGTDRRARPEQADVRQRQVKGRTPRIEPQMTALRPKRSPNGPPMMVPAATGNKNTNK